MFTGKNSAKKAYGNLQKIDGVAPRWVVDARSTFGRWNINILPSSEHGHVGLFGGVCNQANKIKIKVEQIWYRFSKV